MIRGSKKNLTLRVKILNTITMKNSETDISKPLFQFINKIILLEKKNIFEYRGVKLFPSEIHILLHIEKGKSTNATQMSNKLGISKSAVSQTVSRLEKKGVIVKDKDPYNKNELVISFTSFGQKTFRRYKKAQDQNQMHFHKYLKGLSEKDRVVIYKFLNEMGMMIDRFFGTKGHSVYLRPSAGVGSDRPTDGSIEFGYKIIW